MYTEIVGEVFVQYMQKTGRNNATEITFFILIIYPPHEYIILMKMIMLF